MVPGLVNAGGGDGAVMILGTASHVGKSALVAALCRIFANCGIDVAPFKAQNMSLNSAATPDGREIGRAQALQAEAARRPAVVEMNPILLKPTGDARSQVVLEGKIWGDCDAWEYHRNRTVELFPRVVAAYRRLAASCRLVVLEGAGSPAEINLKDGDIVNLRMAEAADAPCVLLTDIDRGGSFAALVGTLELLEPDERKRIVGFAINKFRGDVTLLEPGVRAIEQRLRIPCFGVIPWLEEIGLEEEDSYGVRRNRAPWPAEEGGDRRLRVAVLDLPSVANATDLDALEAEAASLTVRWVTEPDVLHAADVVVIPGSKDTLGDLLWVRSRGFDTAIAVHARTKPVLGLCGGLQILGTRIEDPHGVERGGSARGLGLLPVATSLAATKTTTPARGRVVEPLFGASIAAELRGYEIHVGRSERSAGREFARIVRGDGSPANDGAVSDDGLVAGTYVHGLFDDDAFRGELIDALRRRCALRPARARAPFSSTKEQRIERWAAHVEAALDVEAILACARVRPSIVA